MDKEISTQGPEFYPHTSYSLHKKQRFWQVLFPVSLGVLGILALAVLVVLTVVQGDAGGEVSIWADTSLIWLILPILVFAILMTVLLMGMIFLTVKLLHVLPVYSSKAQYYTDLVSNKIELLARKMVEPVIRIKSAGARIGAIFSPLSGRSRR